MTDLEIVKKCAEKIWLDFVEVNGRLAIPYEHITQVQTYYNPLTDDAQAMALLRKFNLNISHTLPSPDNHTGDWMVSMHKDMNTYATGSDLNRAICECVARLP